MAWQKWAMALTMLAGTPVRAADVTWCTPNQEHTCSLLTGAGAIGYVLSRPNQEDCGFGVYSTSPVGVSEAQRILSVLSFETSLNLDEYVYLVPKIDPDADPTLYFRIDGGAGLQSLSVVIRASDGHSLRSNFQRILGSEVEFVRIEPIACESRLARSP